MKIVKNYLYNASYQLLALILPLITAPYVARTLGPKGVGEYSFTYSIVTWFTLVASIGVAYYGDRQIAYVRDDQQELSKTFWEIQIVKFLMSLLTLILFFGFQSWYQRYGLILSLQAVNILASMIDISWLYNGLEDFKRTVTRNTIVKLLSTVLIFILVHHPSDTWKYVLILACSIFFGNLTLWPRLKVLLEPVKISELRPFSHLKESLILFIPSIATKVYLVLNKTVLGIVVGSTATGFYNNSDQLIQMVLAIVTATGAVILPRASKEFADGRLNKVKDLLYQSFEFVSLIAIPMAFGIAAISLKLSTFFYGESFAPVGPIMMIEAIDIVLIAWSNVIGIQYLLPTKRTKEYTRSLVNSAILCIVISYPMARIFGLKGAMFTTVISELVVTVYQFYLVREDLQFLKLFEDVPKFLASGFIMFLVVFYLNVCLIFNIFTLFIEILLGIIVYFGLLIILRPKILRRSFQILKNKVKGNE